MIQWLLWDGKFDTCDALEATSLQDKVSRHNEGFILRARVCVLRHVYVRIVHM